MRAVDWIGRTLLLILAGLATLSILASLHSASKLPPGWQADRQAAVGDRGTAADPGSSSGGSLAPRATGVAEPASALEDGLAPGAEIVVPVGAESAAADRIAQWLEALTYAVLALAGFAAAGLIVLLRISGMLARLADRG